MATFTTRFRVASERVRHAYEELLRELDALEIALSHLNGPNVRRATEDVSRSAWRLAELLPKNMDQEESAIFPIAQEISPELSDFTREMRRQHVQLRARLANFAGAVGSLARGDELDEARWKVREGGALLIQEVADHVELENRMLDGLV